MLKNMNRFDEEADALYAKYLEIRNSYPEGKSKRALIKYLRELMGAWGQARECMMDAQHCAVDAAPFMHQRLSASTVSVEDKTIHRARDETAMSDEELASYASYYNQLRLRPTSVKPMLILDNEPVSEDALAD
jgi:hypothetical protein